MKRAGSVLVLAATARELTASAGWHSCACGVGPVDAAAGAAAAIAAHRPALVLHVGVAGARRACQVLPCAVVIGTEARYSDLEVSARFAPSSVMPDAVLVAAARGALPDALLLPIGTSARVGGSLDCNVEAMEGFAVLRAAQLAGVPALEVRVISNVVEDADRSMWRLDDAFARLGEITPALVAALRAAVHA